MGKTQQLTNLGREVTKLSSMWFGANSSPIDHIDEIAEKSGINRELVHAAVIAYSGGTYEG